MVGVTGGMDAMGRRGEGARYIPVRMVEYATTWVADASIAQHSSSQEHVGVNNDQ